MKRLLIVVDYQNDFVTGSLGFTEAERLDHIISEKIDRYRENGDIVVFTLDTHDENYLNTQEGKMLPIEHCLRDSTGWGLYGETGKRLSDSPVFTKDTFGSVELFDWLRINTFASIELCGLVLGICVLSNAVMAKAAQPETEIIIDTTATAGPNVSFDKKVLEVLAGLQIKILN